MAGISNDILYEELLRVSGRLKQAEVALCKTRLEMQKTLWELEYGRQRIDRAKRTYEEQLARRKGRSHGGSYERADV